MIKRLYQHIAEKSNREFFITVSFLQVCNKAVTDNWLVQCLTCITCKIYRITGNFCGVKFLWFWSKKKTFNFCGLKISAPKKKIVCITGSNNWSNVTINNWCTLQWSLEVKTYLVLQKFFKRYNFWIRIWLTSNLS